MKTRSAQPDGDQLELPPPTSLHPAQAPRRTPLNRRGMRRRPRFQANRHWDRVGSLGDHLGGERLARPRPYPPIGSSRCYPTTVDSPPLRSPRRPAETAIKYSTFSESWRQPAGSDGPANVARHAGTRSPTRTESASVLPNWRPRAGAPRDASTSRRVLTAKAHVAGWDTAERHGSGLEASDACIRRGVARPLPAVLDSHQGSRAAPSPCFGFGAHNLRLGQSQRQTETGYLQALLPCRSEAGYLGFGRAGRVSKSPPHCSDFQVFPGM
jgi:hypothetical protein